MVTIKKIEKAHFRIEIKDLRSGKTKTISLQDHDKTSVEEIKLKIIKLFS